jgi:hypothetical protein
MLILSAEGPKSVRDDDVLAVSRDDARASLGHAAMCRRASRNDGPPRQQHLPQRDRQPAQVGIGDQPDLLAGQP